MLRSAIVVAELVVGQVAVLIVAAGAEIRTIDLQHKAGFDDGAILDFQHFGQRIHISLLGRVVQVDDEARQDSGRRRGDKHFRRLCLRGGGFEPRQIAVKLCAILVAKLADAAGKRHIGKRAAVGAEIRMRQEIAADHDVAPFLGGARVGRDAGDAVADVHRVGRFRHLAVADHVDTGRNLLGDNVIGRLGDLGFQRLRGYRTVLLAAQDQIDQRLRTRQAAGMGGQNAVGRGLHAGSGLRRLCGVVVAATRG